MRAHQCITHLKVVHVYFKWELEMTGFFKRLTPPKASISITLDKDTVDLGEEVKGTVNVTSEEEIDAEGVRVQLMCILEGDPALIPRGRRGRLEGRTAPPPQKDTVDILVDTIVKGSREEEVSTSVPRRETGLHFVWVGTANVSGPLHLTKGTQQKFTFSIGIPTNLPPTSQMKSEGRYASITWNLKGIIAVKKRPDRTTSSRIGANSVMVTEPTT